MGDLQEARAIHMEALLLRTALGLQWFMSISLAVVAMLPGLLQLMAGSISSLKERILSKNVGAGERSRDTASGSFRGRHWYSRPNAGFSGSCGLVECKIGPFSLFYGIVWFFILFCFPYAKHKTCMFRLGDFYFRIGKMK